MKLKLRADAKDIVIFVIFCIFLLYFVAIAVLNLHTFANENTLHGLNPFPAFTKEYIVYTLFAFVIVLVMIMTSVSSYFFDMEKGFGSKSSSQHLRSHTVRPSRRLLAQTIVTRSSPVEPASSEKYISLSHLTRKEWIRATDSRLTARKSFSISRVRKSLTFHGVVSSSITTVS